MNLKNQNRLRARCVSRREDTSLEGYVVGSTGSRELAVVFVILLELQ